MGLDRAATGYTAVSAQVNLERLGSDMTTAKAKGRTNPRRPVTPREKTVRAPESFDSRKAMRAVRQIMRDNVPWLKEMAEK